MIDEDIRRKLEDLSGISLIVIGRDNEYNIKLETMEGFPDGEISSPIQMSAKEQSFNTNSKMDY